MPVCRKHTRTHFIQYHSAPRNTSIIVVRKKADRNRYGTEGSALKDTEEGADLYRSDGGSVIQSSGRRNGRELWAPADARSLCMTALWRHGVRGYITSPGQRMAAATGKMHTGEAKPGKRLTTRKRQLQTIGATKARQQKRESTDTLGGRP